MGTDPNFPCFVDMCSDTSSSDSDVLPGFFPIYCDLRGTMTDRKVYQAYKGKSSSLSSLGDSVRYGVYKGQGFTRNVLYYENVRFYYN